MADPTETRPAIAPAMLKLVQANTELGMAYTQLLVDLRLMAERWDAEDAQLDGMGYPTTGYTRCMAALRQRTAELRQRASEQAARG